MSTFPKGSLSHHYFFVEQKENLIKSRTHGEKYSWDITTQCQQAWHSLWALPRAFVFLISKKHPLFWICLPYLLSEISQKDKEG